MENQDKLYKEFKEAAHRAEDKGFARMEAVWNRVEDKLDNKKQRRIAAWWKYTGIAALLLLFTGMGFMLLNQPDSTVVPNVKPENGVTVIDTQKIQQTVAPGKETVTEEVITKSYQKRNQRKKTGSYALEKENMDDVIVLRGDKASIMMEDGRIITGDSIHFNTKTKKARVWNSRTDKGEFRVTGEVAENAMSETEIEDVVIESYRTTRKMTSYAAVTTITAQTIEGKQSRKERKKAEKEELAKAKANTNVGIALNNAAYNTATSNTSPGYLSNTSKNYSNADSKLSYTPTKAEIVEKTEVGNVAFPNKTEDTDKDGVPEGYDVLANGKIIERALPVGTQPDAKPNQTVSQALQGRVAGVAVTDAKTPQATTITSETIEGRPNVSFVQSLQGQMPGLNISTGSGSPGSGNTTVILRGLGSLNGNMEPLYVIDGAPSNAENFRKINTNDIESVSVLKDAGATSIYGNRGANGVIIIKTKGGRMGMTKEEIKAFRKEQREEDKKSRKEQRLQEREERRDAREKRKEEREEEKAEEAEMERRTNEKIKVDDESYESFEENKFENPATTPLSTFSIDVDNASYTNIRRFLNSGQTVPKDAVRVEEMVNFFKYDYPQPVGNDPFSINTEYSTCPWNPNHKLLKIGLQGYEIPTATLPASNFVFLIDVSGSMSDSNKLPLLKESMKVLVKNMRKQDRLAIVVYAGAAGLVLPSTSGADKNKIYEALDNLNAGGSTAGGAGIELAYKTAQENFVKGGNNRVVIATDGDFNVGASSDGDMQTLIEAKRKGGVFLTCLGYGMGNYKDSKLETLADKGNGNYAYIDNMQEADRFLDKEFKGSMYAIAKDVKIQIEFNPKHVQRYRLIGYENRKLRDEDFANDAVDAGELGSGHTVTALYEIIPTGVQSDYFTNIPELKYSATLTNNTGNYNDELATIKFRYKKPDGDKSTEMINVIPNIVINSPSGDFKFAAAVAWFGLKLRDSSLVPDKTSENIIKLAKEGLKKDDEGYRAEFIRLVGRVE